MNSFGETDFYRDLKIKISDKVQIINGLNLEDPKNRSDNGRENSAQKNIKLYDLRNVCVTQENDILKIKGTLLKYERFLPITCFYTEKAYERYIDHFLKCSKNKLEKWTTQKVKVYTNNWFFNRYFWTNIEVPETVFEYWGTLLIVGSEEFEILLKDIPIIWRNLK